MSLMNRLRAFLGFGDDQLSPCLHERYDSAKLGVNESL